MKGVGGFLRVLISCIIHEAVWHFERLPSCFCGHGIRLVTVELDTFLLNEKPF